MTHTATPDSYLPPFQDLLAALQQLSSQLVAARLDSSSSNATATDDASTLNIEVTTQQAGPLFAALHAWNRKGLGEVAALRDETMDARIKMEEAYLRLQNLMFEKDHLQREILACQLYEYVSARVLDFLLFPSLIDADPVPRSEYQHLPLVPEDKFLALAQSPNQQPEEVIELLEAWTHKNPSHPDPSSALKAALIDDPHQLMLTRLQNEHNQRKRLDRDKKELSAVKAALVKENERKKARLDQLEQRLELFVKSAKTIQTTMHGDESMAVVSSNKLGQDETSASTGTRDDGEPTLKGAEQDDPTTVVEEGMVVDEP